MFDEFNEESLNNKDCYIYFKKEEKLYYNQKPIQLKDLDKFKELLENKDDGIKYYLTSEEVQEYLKDNGAKLDNSLDFPGIVAPNLMGMKPQPLDKGNKNIYRLTFDEFIAKDINTRIL